MLTPSPKPTSLPSSFPSRASQVWEEQLALLDRSAPASENSTLTRIVAGVVTLIFVRY